MHVGTVLDRELGRLQQQKEMSRQKGATREIPFVELRPWIERNKWDKMFPDVVNCQVLATLVCLPDQQCCYDLIIQKATVSPAAMAGSTSTLSTSPARAHDLISCIADRQKIATILQLFDILMDRYESTAAKTSRNALCWLRGNHLSTPYTKPFTFVHNHSMTVRYRSVMK